MKFPSYVKERSLTLSIEIGVFFLMLLGIVIWHKQKAKIAAGGLLIIGLLQWNAGVNLLHHIRHEGGGLVNLLGLLVGFELLADHFRASKLPELLPKWLPDDWKGGFVLLCVVFVMSGFLDNIAAAMIGGTIAKTVYRGRVSLAFLVAIVAASNGGGAWSPIGDTTTTMMWVRGVPPSLLAWAALPSVLSFILYAVIAAKVQDRHERIMKDPPTEGSCREGAPLAAPRVHVDKRRLVIVAMMLVGGLIANVWWGMPAVGVWGGLLLGSRIRQPHWGKIPHTVKNATFLLKLVLAASLVPIAGMPHASIVSTGALGFVSAVFDNIPLTKLALQQGGYDWGLLAYAVGFGGSMTWFGSSAGVALAGDFPEAEDVIAWIRAGWFVPIAYVIAYVISVAILGWHPMALPPQ